MNEITRIHLAKTPYNIELGAKKALEKYLEEVNTRLHADDDVLREVEARMIELLAQRGVAGDRVIALDDVQALRAQLGEPKEFTDGEDPDDSAPGGAASTGDEKPVKRLMRDVDHAVLGGVCAGFAEYFKVDVLVVRLLALAASVLTAGGFVLVYVVFWIVMPPARTTAEHLMMSGRPVTLEALKESAGVEKPTRPSVLAKIRRWILGTLSLLVMCGVVIGVVVGGYVGYDAVSWMSDFYAQPWAMGVLASLFAGGIALVALLGLLTISAYSGKVTKLTLIAISAMVLVGVAAICSTAIAGVEMRKYLEQDLRRLTKVETISLLGNLSTVHQVQVDGGILSYGGDGKDTLHAEIRYLAVHGAPKPSVSVSQTGETLIFTVTNPQERNCPVLIQDGSCTGLSPFITVYGLQQSYEAVPYVGEMLLN